MQNESFETLRIWKNSLDLTVVIYNITKRFPSDERFGLTDQMRRSAASIGANIAEGKGRRSTKELLRFLYIARGSTYEIVHHCRLAQELGYLSPDDAERLIKEFYGLTIGIQMYIRKIASMMNKTHAVEATA